MPAPQCVVEYLCGHSGCSGSSEHSLCVWSSCSHVKHLMPKSSCAPLSRPTGFGGLVRHSCWRWPIFPHRSHLILLRPSAKGTCVKFSSCEVRGPWGTTCAELQPSSPNSLSLRIISLRKSQCQRLFAAVYLTSQATPSVTVLTSTWWLILTVCVSDAPARQETSLTAMIWLPIWHQVYAILVAMSRANSLLCIQESVVLPLKCRPQPAIYFRQSCTSLFVNT